MGKGSHFNWEAIFWIGLIGMIEEDKKILINISKKWSNRFHKVLSLEYDPSKMICEILDNVDHAKMIPESNTDVFWEPESAEADITAQNTSIQWKK